MKSLPVAESQLAGTPEYAGAFELCVEKTRRNLPVLVAGSTTWALDPVGDYPAWNEEFLDIGNWTTSFFTGMGILSFLRTREPDFLRQIGMLKPLYDEKIGAHAAETMHDLGFLYSLYSMALHLVTGEEPHRVMGIKAASVLADRFVPEGNYIRAWGRMDEPDTDYAGLAIIDTLMNMPLLYWASSESGDPRFREVAIRHTETTLKNFIRPDGSVYHAYRFDPVSGEPMGGENYCGRAVESHWARGTGWAMYGFALAYRHTGEPRYLEACLRLTDFFLASLDDEVVPRWDFRIGPGDPPIRDSSAAAIAVCALQELESFDHASDEMIRMKRALLGRLCSEDYLDRNPECRGILKHGQVGDGRGKARRAYTSWGDYYFMEALAREIGMKVDWW